MKRSSILAERRKHVSPEIKHSVDLSFQIVDRIHEILELRGLKQKHLAERLGKSEAEISKWMRGTHNFTISTLSAIELALDAPVISVVSSKYTLPEDTPHAMVAEDIFKNNIKAH